MKLVIESAVRKLIKDTNPRKRCSREFLDALHRHNERVIKNATMYHNAGKVTLDIEVAAYCGIK